MLETMKKWLHLSASHTENREVRCLCCGDCCESFGGHLQASKSDLERWRREGRDDLLARVIPPGWIWVDPETKETLERCPFITRISEQQEICGIQETKPDICRAYPTIAHGRRCLHGVFLEH